ncbi:hypothetical protein LAB1_09220 [Roseibium sp. LAB1]
MDDAARRLPQNVRIFRGKGLVRLKEARGEPIGFAPLRDPPGAFWRVLPYRLAAARAAPKPTKSVPVTLRTQSIRFAEVRKRRI